MKVLDIGKRIDEQTAKELFEELDLNTLGFLADKKRREFHKDNIVTFVIDRNVNYSNACVASCKFCAFYRKPKDEEAYVLPKDEILKKVRELKERGGTTLLMQGGLNPELGLDYFKDLISSIHQEFPDIDIHSLSAPEIVYLAKIEKMSIKDVIRELKEAGLKSIPGGGAEVLSPNVRSVISKGKCTTEEWIEVHKSAHELGMTTTATMMFGHIETIDDILYHLSLIRDLQDKTGGFTAFIPWTFQKGNTELDYVEPASSVYYLKVLAISRLFLDNFKNIQASHVTQTMQIGTVALHYGANDLGSVMLEENVISSTEFKVRIPAVEDMIKNIKKAGFVPAKRDTYYNILEIYN